MNDNKDIENLLEIEKALGREKFLDLVKEIANSEDGVTPDPTPKQVKQIEQEAKDDFFPEIFISYSRNDWKSHVKPLGQVLYDSGFNVWIDQHIIRSGDDWMDKINEALEKCKVLVLCVSSSALNSRYVKMEYRYFLDENKSVIPVIIEDTKRPAELRGIQYIAYDETDDLIDEIHRRLNNQ